MQTGEKPEPKELVAAYGIAASTARQVRDQLLATCRDYVHEYLQQMGNGDPKLLHEVVDALDEYLRRSKHDGVW